MVDITNLHFQLKRRKQQQKLTQQENVRLKEEVTRLSVENDQLTAMLMYAEARINKMVDAKEGRAHEAN